ncbi:MAG TPA: beta-propeller fold lactonase family protein [Terracidiphilus sp.]|jgi:6-phosphogluconolactonase (cycloisomerase 2 family)
MKSLKLALVVCLLAGGAFALGPQASQAEENHGAVFVMTNAASNNQVIAYSRQQDGSLQRTGEFSTGGNGSGGAVDPLSSQGSLTLSADHRLLFAVNAGSGTMSSFEVEGSSLRLVDAVSSGGSSPTALTHFGNLLYVLNAGGNGNLSGFRVNPHGRLQRIENSTRNLSGPSTSPTSLVFSPNGQFLAVTEHATNNIDIFRVHPNGTLSDAVTNSVPGSQPFAALFAPNGALIVAGTANTISSFNVQWNQTIQTITNALPTEGMATCWDIITPNGAVVYAINANSSNIAGFNIAHNGSLTPVDGTIVGSNPAGSANLDTAISADGKFVYTLNAGTGSIGVFAVQSDGSLTSDGQLGGLAASSGLNGLAAY